MAVRFRPQSIPSDEELEYLSMQNAPLRFERTLDGELLVSPPSGFSIGQQNAELIRQLGNWNLRSGHGAVFDSSTGISIGLNASPDAAWISGKTGCARELVFELRSPSDSGASMVSRANEFTVSVGDGILRIDKSLLPGASDDLVCWTCYPSSMPRSDGAQRGRTEGS